MTNKEIYSIFKKGVSLILECTVGINDLEVDPDSGMRGKLVNIQVMDEGDAGEYLCFIIDFGMFEDLNKTYAKFNYYDSNHLPCESWFQQHWYESTKHKVEIYTEYSDDIFNLVLNDIQQKFLESKSDMTYVVWLEDQVRRLFKERKSDV